MRGTMPRGRLTSWRGRVFLNCLGHGGACEDVPVAIPQGAQLRGDPFGDVPPPPRSQAWHGVGSRQTLPHGDRMEAAKPTAAAAVRPSGQEQGQQRELSCLPAVGTPASGVIFTTVHLSKASGSARGVCTSALAPKYSNLEWKHANSLWYKEKDRFPNG